MEQLQNLSALATVASFFVAIGMGSLALKGVRVGPIRAVTLALKSRIKFVPVSKMSVRKSQIEELRNLLDKTVDNGTYVVVRGPKGVGKSCMIDSFLANTNGVIRVTVKPGTLQEDITKNCHDAIVGGLALRISFQEPNVARVLFWYRMIFRGRPTLVLSMSERPPETKPAQVTGAVRELAAMGIKVLVDASPNSLPPELLTTLRQWVLYIDGLSNEEIRLLPQLQQLFHILDASNLSSLVLDMLDGIPSLFIELSDAVDLSKGDVYDVLLTFLRMKFKEVVLEIIFIKIHEPKFDEIFALLKDKEYVGVDVLVRLKIVLPSPCKVLRQRSNLDVILLTLLLLLLFVTIII